MRVEDCRIAGARAGVDSRGATREAHGYGMGIRSAGLVCRGREGGSALWIRWILWTEMGFPR